MVFSIMNKPTESFSPNKSISGDSKRLNTIDIIKGIGIFFVVFAHVNYTPALLVVIYGFHMPLFFIVSGFLFDKEKYPTFRHLLIRRWQTLIHPYFLYYSLSVLYSFISFGVFEGISKKLVVDHLQYMLQMVLAQGGSATVVSPPFWFVMCLFATECLYFFISKLNSKLMITG